MNRLYTYGLCLALWLGCCVAAWAQVPVRLEPLVDEITLAGKMTWLEDKDESLGPSQAVASRGWHKLSSALSAGFTSSAIWLHFELEQVPENGRIWFLQIDNPILEDVRLYLLGSDANWVEQLSGQAVAHSVWPVKMPRPTFMLELAPGRHVVLLRLRTHNAMSTGFSLWQEESFHQKAQNTALMWGMYFGMYMLVLLFQLFFWYWTGEAINGWYVPYVLVYFLIVALATGYPQALFHWPGSLSTPLLGFTICVILVIATKFSSVQLELDSIMPRLNRVMLALTAVVSFITGSMVVFGHYAMGVVIAQICSLLWTIFMTGLAVVLLRREYAPARIFLLVFGILYFSAGLRYLRNLGLLTPGPVTDYGYPVAAILHLIAMSLFIIYRYNALKQALRVEQSAREEQRDFVAMVSHEFRTPLAIISTSAQQIANNLDASTDKTARRCHNIRGATRRMTALMDDYLSLDRLDGDKQPLRRQACDLERLLSQVCQDWAVGRVRLNLFNVPEGFSCDESLLRIALHNLLANADRHAPIEQPIELNARGDGVGGVRISVTDHGPGIAEDEMPNIFKKYVRGRSAQHRPGAGLGLYLVQRIASLHGGTITVTNAPGAGAEFVLSLPRG